MLKNKKYLFIPPLLGILFFILVYGYRILIPTNTDWLMAGGDLTQHYLGWRAFRLSPWYFPFGIFMNLSYPERASIIYTDSIPILSVFFKSLSSLLPTSFQFFGISVLISFALSGLFSVQILRKYSNDVPSLILCSFLFITAPIMLFNVYHHTALSFHWIIFLALQTIYLYEDKYRDNYINPILIYIVLGILGGSVHIYFAAFSGLILVSFCILDILDTKKIWKSLLCGFFYVSSFIVTVYLLGGFNYYVRKRADGLGIYSLNINGFINPLGWSSFFKDLPVISGGQAGETFAYLGLGVFFLIIICAIIIIKRKIGSGKTREEPGKETADNKLTKHRNIALLFLLIISLIVSLSPSVSLNDKIIFEYWVPKKIRDILEIFRATGRFSWTAVYIIMFKVCEIVLNLNKEEDNLRRVPLRKNKSLLIILAAVLLQCSDMYKKLGEIHEKYSNGYEYKGLVETDRDWEKISNNKDIKHIVLIKENMPKDELYAITDFALDNGLTLNEFYFARGNYEEVLRLEQESLKNPDKNTIFIFGEEDEYSIYNFNFYNIGNFIIGYTGELEIQEKQR